MMNKVVNKILDTLFFVRVGSFSIKKEDGKFYSLKEIWKQFRSLDSFISYENTDFVEFIFGKSKLLMSKLPVNIYMIMAVALPISNYLTLSNYDIILQQGGELSYQMQIADSIRMTIMAFGTYYFICQYYWYLRVQEKIVKKEVTVENGKLVPYVITPQPIESKPLTS